MSGEPLKHKMAAHCESGATTALLNQAGVDVSEPMVFGVAGGIFFGYFRTPMLPFPAFVLRNKPGTIRSQASRRLGVHLRIARFRNPAKAMAALDELLERGTPVGLQVDFFYMDYVPEYTRRHFNAHNIVVLAREGDEYVVSDSYAPMLTRLKAEALRKARFVGGQFAPKGLMFYPEQVPETVDYASAIRKGLRSAAFNMLKIPIPFFGVRGIRYFARKLPAWPKLARDTEHLSHEIMMISVILEEVGTGGGGFRFLYATFLQQAADILKSPELAEMSKVMMKNGDRWRDLALFAARIGKRRDLGTERLRELSDMLLARAEAEKEIFTRLAALAK